MTAQPSSVAPDAAAEPDNERGRAAPAAAGNPAAGRVRLRTLVYIRWFAVTGQAASLLLVHYGLGFHLPLPVAFAIVGTSVALNILVSVRQPLSMRLPDRAAALYLAYDMIQLTALLYLTGGLQNPFAVLILASVTVSATILSRGSTVGLGLIAGICITLLAFWHEPFPWNEPGFILPDMYIMGIWQALVVGTLFVAAYAGSVSEEARQMSNALAATQMALEREVRLSELGALAAAAAHELGSPLATIAVTAKEMQRDVPEDDPLATDVRLIIEQSHRCREILAQLARQPESAGGEPYALLPLSAVVELAAEPHESGGIAVMFGKGLANGVEADSEGAEEPIIRHSAELIHGLATLVQNATQFAKSRVDIDTRWSRDEAIVSISDDGAGFPAGILDRLGEPYLSTRGKSDGTGDHMGLGVFIAQTLLSRTGASVSFRNRPGGRGKAKTTGAVATIRWARRDLSRLGESSGNAVS